MISYLQLLSMIKKKKIPNEVALHILNRKIIYKKDCDNDGSFNCYVIKNPNQVTEDINFYLRDTLLDSQSFDKCIEIIDENIKELPMIYNGNAKDEIMRNRYKINELVRRMNKLKAKKQ